MMNITDMSGYEHRKIRALHSVDDWQVDTSPMEQDGTYHKSYIDMADRSIIWFEVVRPVRKRVEVNLDRLCIYNGRETVEMEFTEVEGWGKDGVSYFAYERR